MFRGRAVGDNEARAAVERAARALVAALAALPPVSAPVDVTAAEGEVTCRVRVGPAGAAERAVCRADVLEVVGAAGAALTRKEVVQALRRAGRRHGPGTVAKALAELTRGGELVNPRDGRGYRMAGWRKDKTPSLFD